MAKSFDQRYLKAVVRCLQSMLSKQELDFVAQEWLWFSVTGTCRTPSPLKHFRNAKCVNFAVICIVRKTHGLRKYAPIITRVFVKNGPQGSAYICCRIWTREPGCMVHLSPLICTHHFVRQNFGNQHLLHSWVTTMQL